MKNSEIEFPWEGRILSVTNLNFDVRPGDFRDLFMKRGKVYRVDIQRNKKGTSSGLAFIEFATTSDCDFAAELNGIKFKGRTLKCKISHFPSPELICYYIRSIEKSPLTLHTRSKIIENAIKGVSSNLFQNSTEVSDTDE
jgi:RNA recognition motif-containing protein